MIRALIVDDEKPQRDTLTGMLSKYCKQVELVDICSSVPDGILSVKKNKPDLVFLDVEMKPHTGFDLLEAVKDIPFEVIFTTSFNKYAVQAIRFSAVDFLEKPFSPEDLKAAIARYEEKVRNKPADSTRQLEILLHNFKNSNLNERKIGLPVTHGLEFIAVNEIIRCHASSNYTEFHLKGKKMVLSTKTLKEVENLLAEYDFFRVHDSDMINLQLIKSYTKGEGGTVLMTDDSEVDVSRRRKDDFKKKLVALKMAFS